MRYFSHLVQSLSQNSLFEIGLVCNGFLTANNSTASSENNASCECPERKKRKKRNLSSIRPIFIHSSIVISRDRSIHVTSWGSRQTM